MLLLLFTFETNYSSPRVGIWDSLRWEKWGLRTPKWLARVTLPTLETQVFWSLPLPWNAWDCRGSLPWRVQGRERWGPRAGPHNPVHTICLSSRRWFWEDKKKSTLLSSSTKIPLLKIKAAVLKEQNSNTWRALNNF